MPRAVMVAIIFAVMLVAAAAEGDAQKGIQAEEDL